MTKKISDMSPKELVAYKKYHQSDAYKSKHPSLKIINYQKSIKKRYNNPKWFVEVS